MIQQVDELTKSYRLDCLVITQELVTTTQKLKFQKLSKIEEIFW